MGVIWLITPLHLIGMLFGEVPRVNTTNTYIRNTLTYIFKSFWLGPRWPWTTSDSGEVLIFRMEWLAVQFPLWLDGQKLGRYVGSQEPTHRKVGSKPHHAPRWFSSKVGPTGSNLRRNARRWLFNFIICILLRTLHSMMKTSTSAYASH